LAGDALLTTLHLLFENMLQTAFRQSTNFSNGPSINTFHVVLPIA